MSPRTDDPEVADGWLDRSAGGGVDEVVAKRGDSPYEPGRRTMVKVKLDVTVDCVVGGFRPAAKRAGVGSLLLGLYEGPVLHHVGVVSSLGADERAAVAGRLRDLVVPLEGHPWEHGFALEGGAMGRLPGSAGRWVPGMRRDWIPVRPSLVCEVGYDQLDGVRFRHPARFKRWRPDRTPASCTVDQLAGPGAEPVSWLLGAPR